MPITEAAWKARLIEKAQSVAPARAINEGLLRQAVVASDLLTGHPAWDTYLQRLQVLRADSEAQLTQWQEKIPGAYTDEDLRLVQIHVSVYTECVALLRRCMQLPKEILAHAHDTLDKPTE